MEEEPIVKGQRERDSDLIEQNIEEVELNNIYVGSKTDTETVGM